MTTYTATFGLETETIPARNWQEAVSLFEGYCHERGTEMTWSGYGKGLHIAEILVQPDPANPDADYWLYAELRDH